ncbi:MAG: acyltransferase, partial [Pseudomonadota bacterium]
MSGARENRHWAHIGESTFLFGIATLYWVHRLLGRRCFTFVLRPVVLFYWLARPGLRANSLQYLQRIEAATGALGHTADWRDGCRHVTLFAETMLDKLLAVSGRYHFKSVKMIGREALRPGCLIVTAHLGCLELCRTMGDRFGGKKLNILVHTRHAEKFNSILKRLNPNNAMRLIEVSEINPMTMVMLAEKIDEG